MKELEIYDIVFNPEEDEEAIGLYGISLVDKPAIKVEGLYLKDNDEKPTEKEVLDYIDTIGEDRGNDYVEFYSEDVIDDFYGDEEIIKALKQMVKLAELPANMTGEGNEDVSGIYKVRYSYAPLTTQDNSREFCIKMVNASRNGRMFKREELEAPINTPNPGFGLGGSNSYNILKYKGGVNCKHFFRRHFLVHKDARTSVGADWKTLAELVKKINKGKEARDKVKMPGYVPKEMGDVASAKNNFWRVNLSEIKPLEEERVFVGPVLIPEQLIYQRTEMQGEHYIRFNKETIKALQQSFFKNNYHHNSTINHEGESIKGVYFYESWIVEHPDDKANKVYGFDLPVGTFMVKMKIDNDAIWNDYIKTGDVRGFSIDGLVNRIPSGESANRTA